MNRWMRWIVATGAVALVAACGGGGSSAGTVAQVAQQQGLTALNAAVQKAGLADALSDGAASLTVFAPTDAAFTALATSLGFPSATAMVEALPPSALANILSYHVLPTKQQAADLAAGAATQPTLYKFEGAPATVRVSATAGVSLTDAALTTARVTSADVAASNGVVHVIDKVLVPPGVLNIVQMAQVNPLFSTLVGAVVKANLQATLAGTGPFTVFAPTNAAFGAIASTVAGLSNQQLANVLTYHVVPGQVLAAAIPFGTPVTTVLGQSITINAGTPPTVRDSTTATAAIVATDVRASNGVIHVIDKVLIPNPI